MDKKLKMLALALTIGAAMCGTAMAAPKGNTPPKGRAPAVAKALPPARHVAPAKKGAPSPAMGRHVPAKPAPRHEVARHANPPPPPPPARRHEPAHRHHDKHHHHGTTLHTEDWCAIGASLIGGLIGGIIGAAS